MIPSEPTVSVWCGNRFFHHGGRPQAASDGGCTEGHGESPRRNTRLRHERSKVNAYGDKTGDLQFYERFILIADRLYDEHLVEIGASGSGDGDDGSSCFHPASGETVAGGSG